MYIEHSRNRRAGRHNGAECVTTPQTAEVR
jgi:hypothetical protein